MLDAELQGKHGGDRKSEEAEIKSNNVTLATPQGNTKEKGLRRLRKDRPDLHDEVVSGKLENTVDNINDNLRPDGTSKESEIKTDNISLDYGNGREAWEANKGRERKE